MDGLPLPYLSGETLSEAHFPSEYTLAFSLASKLAFCLIVQISTGPNDFGIENKGPLNMLYANQT